MRMMALLNKYSFCFIFWFLHHILSNLFRFFWGVLPPSTLSFILKKPSSISFTTRYGRIWSKIHSFSCTNNIIFSSISLFLSLFSFLHYLVWNSLNVNSENCCKKRVFDLSLVTSDKLSPKICCKNASWQASRPEVRRAQTQRKAQVKLGVSQAS